MGLDNSLIIKGKTEKGKKYLSSYWGTLEDSWTKNEYEFMYFRKCWNIRERFLDVFDAHNGDYEIKITINDIPIVINKVLKYFLNEYNWEYNGHCSQVFSWVTMLPAIAKAIYNLTRFYIEVTDNFTDNDFEICFYDSY